jgi:hypothetical protein
VTSARGSSPEEQQPPPQSAAVRSVAGLVAARAAAGTPPHASAHTQQQAALQSEVARQSAALAALAAGGTSAADAAAAAAPGSRQPLAALPQSPVRTLGSSPQQRVQQQQQQQPAAPGDKTWLVWRDLGSDEVDADGPLTAEAVGYTGTCFVWSRRRMRKPQQLQCVPAPRSSPSASAGHKSAAAGLQQASPSKLVKAEGCSTLLDSPPQPASGERGWLGTPAGGCT